LSIISIVLGCLRVENCHHSYHNIEYKHLHMYINAMTPDNWRRHKCDKIFGIKIVYKNLRLLSLFTILSPVTLYISPRSTFHQARSVTLPCSVWAHSVTFQLFSFTPSTALSGVPLSSTPGYWSVGFPRAILGPVKYWCCLYFVCIYYWYNLFRCGFFQLNQSVSNTNILISGMFTSLFTPKVSVVSCESDVRNNWTMFFLY